jgi:hypothetical protein
MKPISQLSETEVKSVWANGEYVPGPIETFSPPTGNAPYWTVTLESGEVLIITGQVIAKRGPKV